MATTTNRQVLGTKNDPFVQQATQQANAIVQRQRAAADTWWGAASARDAVKWSKVFLGTEQLPGVCYVTVTLADELEEHVTYDSELARNSKPVDRRPEGSTADNASYNLAWQSVDGGGKKLYNNGKPVQSVELIVGTKQMYSNVAPARVTIDMKMHTEDQHSRFRGMLKSLGLTNQKDRRPVSISHPLTDLHEIGSVWIVGYTATQPSDENDYLWVSFDCVQFTDPKVATQELKPDEVEVARRLNGKQGLGGGALPPIAASNTTQRKGPNAAIDEGIDGQ